jgi:Tfp pilus assembly pilus retraction ATPase PilT
MTLDRYVALAAHHGASDLHLEADMPVTLRVRGELRSAGEPISGDAVKQMALELVGSGDWPRFLQRQSADIARTVASIRCRINPTQGTASGVMGPDQRTGVSSV